MRGLFAFVGCATIFVALSLPSVSAEYPYCVGSFVPIGASEKYDLSIWASMYAQVAKGSEGRYQYVFDLCSPLTDPCPDYLDSPKSSRCPTTLSAGVCQLWAANTQPKSAGKQYSLCAGHSNPRDGLPTYAGNDTLIFYFDNGDNCTSCQPAQYRRTEVHLHCAPTVDPKLSPVVFPASTNPVYVIDVDHCSGCPVSDSRYCSNLVPPPPPLPVPPPVSSSTPSKFVFSASDDVNGGLTFYYVPSQQPWASQLGADGQLVVFGSLNPDGQTTVISILVEAQNPLLVGKMTVTVPVKGAATVTMTDLSSGRDLQCSPSSIPLAPKLEFYCGFEGRTVIKLHAELFPKAKKI
eukprot:TRINITY_DN3477_c0_g1_i1.p1 TRINITY_DN3477_c0_g1~~TRINITY_DN3477_c0_g1_i1.p1  ORF type:complete len:350 (+),score=49.15 TRINITY_DN3477_c0_g1_i1:39-1088(+)